MIQSWLKQKIASHYPGVAFDVLVPPDRAMGDYSANIAFIMAKQEGKNPVTMGKEIAEKLQGEKDVALMFEKIEVVPPGFINLTLKSAYIKKQLANIHSQGLKYGRSVLGKGKKVIVEYPSTNVAKAMHVGHSRPAFIGDALARVYEYLGYQVIRWDYLGDWGTQFGMLIAAYKMWGDKKKIQSNPLDELQTLYVRYNKEAKENEKLFDTARNEFRKLEEGDKENKKLWEWFKTISLKEARQLYKQLDLLPSTIEIGESFYQEDVRVLVDSLIDQKIAERSEGAIVVNLEDSQLPTALLQKSDGSSLYLTRDIANLMYRLENHNPSKILYVVANQQALHFQQLFAIAGRLDLNLAELVHVKFGLILGEDNKKLASREGTAASLNEVLKKSIALATEVVKGKNPELSSKELEQIAHAVGVGALKYNDLQQHPHSDIAFDWDRMLDFSGNSGPYLQYTYARLASIRRKAGGAFFRRFLTPDLNLLETEHETYLMRYLLDFPETIKRSAEQYALNNLALYLSELANLTNRFYESVRILDDENTKRRDARIFLIEAVMNVLSSGLNLLGIKTLERI